MEERFVGSMLGLALADAMGARYEGGIVGQLLWKVVAGDRLRWTDDTQMAVGLAESLVEKRELDADHLARRWAERMDPMRGYGPGARKLLRMVRDGSDWREANRAVFPDGSFGNGAGMRAAPIGLVFHGNARTLIEKASLTASITHAHPLGIEAGVLIALATALALDDSVTPEVMLDRLMTEARHEEYRDRLNTARAWLGQEPSKAQVRKRLGTSVLAHESAVTAVHAFCRHPDDFTAMVDYVIGLGGDTDTIGAMAGGIFGARNGAGALAKDALSRLEACEEIEATARALHATFNDRRSSPAI